MIFPFLSSGPWCGLKFEPPLRGIPRAFPPENTKPTAEAGAQAVGFALRLSPGRASLRKPLAVRRPWPFSYDKKKRKTACDGAFVFFSPRRKGVGVDCSFVEFFFFGGGVLGLCLYRCFDTRIFVVESFFSP